MVCHKEKYSEDHAELPPEKQYERRRVPCPDAAEFNCSKTFSRPGRARRHAIIYHKENHSEEFTEILEKCAEERKVEKERFPCPGAIEFNCLKTFATRGGAKAHANKYHCSRKPYPCPMAAELRCSKAFSNLELAKAHVDNKHGGKKLSCPRAKQLACPQLFSTAHEARHHTKIHTSSQPKYVNGLKIAIRSNSSRACNEALSKCTVPACRHAVSGMRMAMVDMDQHMLHHEYAGHREGLMPYPAPVAAKNLESEEVEELLTIMDSALEGAGDKDSGNQGTTSQLKVGMNADIGIEGVRLYRIPEFQNGDTKNVITCDDGLEYIQQCYENQHFHQSKEVVVGENVKFRRRNTRAIVDLRNFKLNCLGPGDLAQVTTKTLSFVEQRCPHGSIITLQTAFLEMKSNGRRTIGFQPRCAACEEHRTVTSGLRDKSLLANRTAELDCNVRNCFRRRWWKTKFCQEHTRAILQSRLFRPRLLPNVTVVAKSLARSLAHRWCLSKNSACTALMQKFLERGKRGEQRWICLDIETVKNTLGSRETWQIGNVDYHTGEVLIDEYIEHFCPSNCHCKAVVHRSRDIRPEALGKLFQAKEIQQCNVLVWCKTYYDMKYTRACLAKAGLEALLPPNDQCLLILNQVAANFTFALDLGSMHSAVCPGGRLLDQHHDALADARMLRNLVTELEPAWEWGWNGEEKRKALQHRLQQQGTLDTHLIF